MPRTRALIRLLCAACLLMPPGAFAESYRWSDVERVVAISDPHGAYEAMVRTLASAGVIDESLNWVGGATHLVITGDLLDRGAESRQVMDLVMRLEALAADSGGAVHLTLGNHEVMNLVGDLRYVSRGEYAAFAAEESTTERERWFQHFKAARERTADEPPAGAALREEFDAARPPGFFAHRRAFSPSGEYGAWLSGKPLLIVINDTAYVHGGLSPLVAALGLERLNDELRAQVSDYMRHLETLHDRGVMDPALNFYEHAAAARKLLADETLADDIRSALEGVVSLAEASVHSLEGPLWYRGTIGCNVLEESDLLADSLAAIGADRVVIGHTPTVTRRVLQRFDGRVIEIDTGMLNAAYRGRGHALVLAGAGVDVVREDGESVGAPVPHPRRVGTEDIDDDDIERLLADGEIGSVTEREGDSLVELQSGDGTVRAVFTRNPRRRGFAPALAAYRLDRLIGLDMVPVTVAREVGGRAGTLQYLPPNTLDEQQRAAAGQGGGAWCPLTRQWNAMYVFDAFVHNAGRQPADIRYDTDEWQLLLTGNTNTFDSNSGLPRYLANAPLVLGPTWTATLRSLTDEVLTERFSDVLDKRRIAALGKRRDLLLELSQQAAASLGVPR